MQPDAPHRRIRPPYGPDTYGSPHHTPATPVAHNTYPPMPDRRHASQPLNRPHATGGGDVVTVHTRAWCTIAMMAFALLANIVQPALRSNQYAEDSAGMDWCTFSFLVGLLAIIIIPFRSAHPERALWCACALVLIFPLDSLMPIMLLTSALARRGSRRSTARSILIATATALCSQVRDALQPAGASLWSLVFSKPHTEKQRIIIAVSPWIMDITAILTALAAVALAAAIGLHIRSQAKLRAAMIKVNSVQHQADSLRQNLSDKQLSQAIAAEAHDTLAHSLTLISLNANALQLEAGNCKAANRPGNNEGTDASTAGPADAIWLQDIQNKAKDIQRQAQKALDEAHNIIAMLKDPQMALKALAPTDETSLTRESLEELIGGARQSGTEIATWIDVQQLSTLHPGIGKVAYRAIQEGLTNAARHAHGQPVALEVNANPQHGVHVRLSNAATATTVRGNMPATNQPLDNNTDMGLPPATQHATASGGHGLHGLTERARKVGGTCSYGIDEHHRFILTVALPWISLQQSSMPESAQEHRSF